MTFSVASRRSAVRADFNRFSLRPVCQAIALMLTTGAAMNAQAGTNLAHIGAQMSAARTAAGGAGVLNLGVSPQQALQASQPSIQNLAHAAQTIAQQIAAQQLAAGVAATLNVPNGLAPGGLQVAPGVSADTSNPNLWINANQPTQSVDGNGHVDVTIKQTAQNAVLTWQTMNVGRQTTLNFDQSSGAQTNGANNWAVLNRIEDPSGQPSQILGNITAQGAVYVINRNGILFGAGSQVNVHSLVASSLDVLNMNDYNQKLLLGGTAVVDGNLAQDAAGIAASNQQFLGTAAGTTGGLVYPESGSSAGVIGSSSVPNEVLGLGNEVNITSTSQLQPQGNVTIEQGASITTHVNGTVSDGGFVMIAGPNVTNAGSIIATDGQVVLAAGVGVSLRPNATPQVLTPELSGAIDLYDTQTGKGVDITPVGKLVNTGIVQAVRGNVNLLGGRVDQDGAVGVTTSVNAPGTITISTVDEYSSNTPLSAAYQGHGQATGGVGAADATNRSGLLSFGANSVTTVLPDAGGQTTTSTPGTTFTPGQIAMTAGSVWFQDGSLVEAPGSSVSVAALSPGVTSYSADLQQSAVPGRIYVDNGATIDVSGLANVELPISDILLTIDRIGQNELADSPLLRDSFLNGLKGAVVDSTLTGTRADGVQWVGSPILNLSGYVNDMPRTIDQLLINGGTIMLSGNEVMTADGSSLNLNGGYIHYDGGIVNTTRLIDANGAIVPIGEASPYDSYVGIAGQFVESHPRWGVTKTWYTPLLVQGTYEDDFIVGGNAGTLDVYGSQAVVLDGGVSAQAFGGAKQEQDDASPTGGAFNLGADPFAAKSSALLNLTWNNATPLSGVSSLVVLQDTAPQLDDLAPGFSMDTPLDPAALGTLSNTDPNNVLATMVVPVSTLNDGGFAKLGVTEDKFGGKGFLVTADTQLKLQAGGSIVMSSGGGGANLLGQLIVPSGTISVSTGGDIVVGPQALLSVAGQWVNNDVLAAPGTAQGNSAFINGGSISLSTLESSSQQGGTITDTSGSIILQPGSVLDVSSGGELLPNGQLLTQNGIPEGLGGNVTLRTYNTSISAGQFGHSDAGDPPLPTSEPTNGHIDLGGTILSDGFAGGGTLTLQALGFQIGGDPSSAPSWDLYLPASFFSEQGFGRYVLNAFYDATIAPGTTVALTQRNLIPDVPALAHAATGADLLAGGLTTSGTLDAYHRQATGLDLTGGNYVSWVGAGGNPPTYSDVTGAVTVSQDASIIGDAGASIGLGSPTQVTVLGSIVAPGGSITLSADGNGSFALPGQFSTGYLSDSESVWLGSNAVLDVSGVALTNPYAAPVRFGSTRAVPDTGKVLAGGTVVLSSDTGYAVAQDGSRIDVSGSAANFDQLQANGTYASQPVWSNAGSITLSVSDGLFVDATLQAHGGASQAEGGTLSIIPHQNADSANATAIVIRQNGELVPLGLAPGESFVTAIDRTTGQAIGTPTGVLQFAVDRLDGSGIANLVLGNTAGANKSPPPIVFAGDVQLSLSGSLTLNADRIVALGMDQLATLLSTPAQQPDANSTPPTVLATMLAQSPQPALGTTVTINAPYVAFVEPPVSTNQPGFSAVSALSDATLNVNAAFIDLSNQVQLNNFGQANFTSSGDIRLSATLAGNATGATVVGLLYTPGNLTFKAADLYPATGSTFIVDAAGPLDATTNTRAPTSVTFETNGASSTPLAAGGSLFVDATSIVQGGTVRAPSGSLVLGVGDPTDATTLAQFDNLPLVATDSVALTKGSVTSVSNGGLIIPYGTTIDGVEWQFNAIVGGAASDLAAPPAKYIGVNASRIALDPGATIDLSGGGDLQAAEWVAGTGGTRDVLSQYSVSYANSAAGVAVPVNANASNVYAIVPGAQSPVAAYDPVFAQTAQPSAVPNGSVATQTDTMGLGQAGLTDAIGRSVYLSGVPGLAAGYYTLLPAKYATLPGAYRVTVSSTGGNLIPGGSATLPDGTIATAGYFADAITGARSATPTLFDVQSGAVWQQYSQYTLTSASSFFTSQAASKGNATPPLPIDGGQLVLAATRALTLGATLNTAAGQGGAPAEVDIASQDIQITGNGSAGIAGYLQIDAGALDSLNAGSLLIGGTRTATADGVTITPLANSVLVSNDASTSLIGPEILLVTKTDPSGTDPNAANGLRIDAGASIVANGDYPAAKDQPITIAGDGALLRVSNGTSTPLTRTGTTGTGLLDIGANATLSGGQSLLIDSSGDLKVDPSAVLSGHAITADGSAITFTNATGAAAAGLSGYVIDPAELGQFANADQVTLRSYGAIDFVGDIDATFGNYVDLSAGTFVSDGGHVTLNAPQIAFTNEINTGANSASANPADGTAANGSGTLTVNAQEIDFGVGTKTLSGFGSVDMTATAGIAGQGTGTFDFGTVPLTLTAPIYLADTNSLATLKTTGTLTLNAGAGKPLDRTALGGAFDFIGGTLSDNGALIAAPAGNVSLEASSGNLTIAQGATVSSAGVSKQFFDVTEYAPAGSITLTADAGTVDVQAGTTLDFSGASGGGAAGKLTLSAPQQVVNLAGTLDGGAASGYAGGSLSLDTGGAVDLDTLAATLASSGVNQAIAIRTNTGNLTLSAGNSLVAHVVSLTADGGAGNATDTSNGNVNILGTIDASGNAGGEIDLFGHSGVDLEGTLLARGSDPAQRGGTVNLGTNGVFDPNAAAPYNTTYGYENFDPSKAGVIRLGADALIDVSGGTAGGLSGGTVSFRAPVLSNDTVNLILPASGFNPDKGIVGSRATRLEAYAVWSTTDATTGAQHFDGIIDPAGWYDSRGQLLAGTFTSQDGSTKFSFSPDTNGDGGGTVTNNTTGATTALTQQQLLTGDTAIGFGGLDNMDFALSGSANADHTSFYGYQNGDATAAVPGTLMGFVQHGLDTVSNPLLAAGLANAILVPGIELDNPSPSINGGNIEVLTNWNLGAGSSPTNLAYRFNNQAPIITLRAEHDVDLRASLTDGFFQIANPLGGGGTIAVPALSNLSAAQTLYTEPSGPLASYGYGLSYYGQTGLGLNHNLVSGPGTPTGGTADEIAEYYALYTAYADYLAAPATQITSLLGLDPSDGAASVISTILFNGRQIAGQPVAPVAPPASQQASDPASYLIYLNAYQNYLLSLAQFVAQHSAYPAVEALAAPVVQPVAVIGSATISVPATTDNSPSPVVAADNPIPILSASLGSGSSASFRVVAGANTSSVNPLATQVVAQAGTTPGNVTLDGYTSYIDPTSQALLSPTMIRTGTGSIDVAAAGDIALFDSSATSASAGDAPTLVVPGVIYTAGTQNTDAPASGTGLVIVHVGGGRQDILVTPTVNPDSAGDITLQAGGDIVGLENLTDATGTVTGKVGSSFSQFWWQWMQITPAADVSGRGSVLIPLQNTSIDFGAFDQGVMSVGGNVSISAGGTIADLGVSLPTTWYLDSTGSVVTVGGGNLSVNAGADILSGDYFVAKGTGTIAAGGRIASDISIASPFLGLPSVEVATLLATQDGVLNVTARQGADIGKIVDPSYVQSEDLLLKYDRYSDGQGYSSTSAVNVTSTTGDVTLGTMTNLTFIEGGSSDAHIEAANDLSFVLPASVSLTALDGGITVASSGELYPSATGNLNLVADQSIQFSGTLVPSTGQEGPAFGLLDVDPSTMRSPTNRQADVGSLTDTTLVGHAVDALHGDDTTPVRIYSLDGDIVDGVPFVMSGTTYYQGAVTLGFDKPALIEAGRDVVNLAFLGQNLRDADVTRIVAGRDIYDAPVGTNEGAAPALVLGGPGTFDVEAGRNIGPLATPLTLQGFGNRNLVTGIDAVGNADNPSLPHESADVNVLFGIGPGIDTAGFISSYVDPSSSIAAAAGTSSALTAFVEQYEAGQVVDTGLLKDQQALLPLTAAQAWAVFQTLPSYVQQFAAQRILFNVLTQVGEDYNNPASPFYQQYARGYTAINTLFPASLGYTANNLGGGSNGANQLVDTGDLDIRNTTIQTQQGGNVTILGPGGQALVGSTSAPPELVDTSGSVIAGPGTMGILTLEKGDIDIFTDRSLLLAQSRIFTEQGGGMTIWSSNGDINAGKGAKSSADEPAPQYLCDVNHYCTVDARGEVTGAGIATLQTIPGALPGDVNLIAPRGTVDAGDAGIRVSGNLNVAALHVANADNIQVQGKATGIPIVAAVNTGALTAAGSVATAASQMAQEIVKRNASGVPQRHWTITVQVEGFGEPGGDDDNRKRRRPTQVSYDPASPVGMLGVGQLGDAQRRHLTPQEENRLDGV